MRISLLLFLLAAGTSMAQKPWTFRQCLDTALLRNLTVNQTRMSHELNKVTLKQSLAGRIPSLSASAGEGLSIGKNIDPTSNAYITEGNTTTNLGVSSSVNLFNGFQTANTIRQNRILVSAGESDIEKAKNDVTLNITQGYLQVLFAREILQAARSQAEASAAQVERTGKMVNAGKSPESDLLQVQSQLATDNLSVITAENNLDLAKVTLMQLMDIPVDDVFDIETPVLEEISPSPALTRDQIYVKSLQAQPQVAAATLRTSASEMALKVSEGARWPRVSLGANVSSSYSSSRKTGPGNSQAYPFTDQIWDNLGQSLSLGVSIPIYSNRQVRSNIEKARINRINSQLSEQNVKNTLRKTIEQTFTDLRAAGKKYDAVKQQVTAVESVYRSAEQKFSVGVMSATDFLIQKNNLSQSQSSLIQAKFDYIFKQKILDFYQGQAITF